MKRSVESILFALSGIIMSAALLLLLLTSAGCSDGAGSDGGSFDICADSKPTCYANCDGTETLEPECGDDGEWSCPSESVDPSGPSCNDNSCGSAQPDWMCAPGCGGDVFAQAECQDGTWVCPDGTTNVDDCPEDTCWGMPAPCQRGCVEPNPIAASCDGGAWSCPPEAIDPLVCQENPCEIVDESTLPGVTMSLQIDTCAWTVFEVRDGFAIDYTIEVEEPIEVQPTEQDAGGCGSNVHPLSPFYVFSGNDQQHCLCDTGLCMRDEQWVTLEPGTYTATIEWAGRNWSGPSDTGNEPGEVFPPGSYSLDVSADGKYRAEDGTEQDYSVSSSLEFQLVE